MTAPLLTVQDLTKTFGAVRAVDNVSFDLAPGETLALAGPSGSGKSTIARLALRLMEPDAGHIKFRGGDLSSLTGERLRAKRRHIQMVFQDTNAAFNPHATVASALLDPLRIFRVVPRSERLAEAERLLERVGLNGGLLGRPVHELSGGQRQRVAIARAIATGPSLIVLDEALSAVDVSIRAGLIDLLLDLQATQNIAYLFIVHDLALIRAIAHRVAILENGKIAELGPADEVTSKPRSQIGRELLAAAPRLFGKRGKL